MLEMLNVIEATVLIEKGRPAAALRALPARRLRKRSDIRDELGRVGSRSVWIAPDAPAAGLLLGSLGGSPRGDRRLLLAGRVDGSRLGILHAFFSTVVAVEEGVKLLPVEELVEVLSSQNRADLFIGAATDPDADLVLLYRGDLQPLVVPLEWFRRRQGGPRPALSDVEIIDYGQGVRLGQYEAASDAILYELDPGYRRRAKEVEIEQDRSFGGSLRRLRLQRGLSRSDFPGVSEKSIARIERGEVESPQVRTLARIAERLRVSPDEISSY